MTPENTSQEWTPEQVESHDKWLMTPEGKATLQELNHKIEAKKKGILCSECKQPLTPATTFEYNGLLYCPEHLPVYDKHQQF